MNNTTTAIVMSILIAVIVLSALLVPTKYVSVVVNGFGNSLQWLFKKISELFKKSS